MEKGKDGKLLRAYVRNVKGFDQETSNKEKFGRGKPFIK